MFFEKNDAKAETPVLQPPRVKSWFIGKDSDAGRDWGQEEKETARVIIDILGISELKWNGMGEINSDDHYIYYCGKDPLEEMEEPS